MFVRAAEEGGGRNAKQLLVLAQPLDESIVRLLVRLSAQIHLEMVLCGGVGPSRTLQLLYLSQPYLICELAPVGHDEVASLRDHRIQADILEDFGNGVALLLQVWTDGVEKALGRINPSHLLL